MTRQKYHSYTRDVYVVGGAVSPSISQHVDVTPVYRANHWWFSPLCVCMCVSV